MLRIIIFYLTLATALFAQGVLALNNVTSQNGVSAIGQFESIAVTWTNTCKDCSWQLSTKSKNDSWVIQKVLPKGSTKFTITGLLQGHQYQVKMDAKRANRWVTRALLSTSTAPTVIQTSGFLTNLISLGYSVVQGNIFLFENSDCPEFVDIFNSCFGNNPAGPYIIPQPPIENSYVDPYYAVPLNTPGPNNVTTNITYRLSDFDALVTIVSYPPKGAYFGYQSYVFTSQASNYPVSDPLQVISPDPARYEIFGSVGNDVNNIVVQNQNGTPWGGRVITYLTTSNQELANDIIKKLTIQGVNPNSILVEKLGSNVLTGNGETADDFVTLMRYALPKNSRAASNWYNHVTSNVLVYKVSTPNKGALLYPINQYSARTGNVEIQLTGALNELAALLQNWSVNHSVLGSLSAVSTSTFTRTTIDDLNGIPHGLVGNDCIKKGTICAGDNQDTSTYAFSPKFDLSSSSILFIAGVDHNKLNNSSYISLDVYNAAESAGIASSSQANFSAVGFNSGNLTGSQNAIGSAEAVVRELGIYHSASKMLKLALPNLYISLLSKNCTIAKEYCINLSGNTLIPDTTPPTPINIYERSYLRPGDTTAANTNIMVYPRVIGPGKI